MNNLEMQVINYHTSRMLCKWLTI